MTSNFIPCRDRSQTTAGTVVDVDAPARAAEMSGESLMPAHLLSAWEAAYQDYRSTLDRMDTHNVRNRDVLAWLSAQVAVPWCRLATSPGV
jgi:hypothetical protein